MFVVVKILLSKVIMSEEVMKQESYILRKATAEDEASIRDLIWAVRINPLGLDWRRFVIAQASDGQIIGCGQIKPHSDGTRELASIAVVRGWRRRGVARAIIKRLMASQSGPYYLTCRARLGKLYVKFNFQRIEPADMPPYYRRIARLSGLLKSLKLLNEDLWVMRADN